MTTGYSAADVASLLGLSVAQVRGYVREGFLSPTRGERGQLRFSFQDVVLLRAAKGLIGARIAPRRIKRALHKLKTQLPHGRPLTGVSIGAEGNRIVVRDGGARWNPESGQVLFDFSVAELAAQVAPLRADRSVPEGLIEDAETWFGRGCVLEESGEHAAAIEAYRHALELEAELPEAHVNLGRLLHEGGHVAEALIHYQAAQAARPEDATAAYNIGVALDDLGRVDDAIEAYRLTVALDRRHADAHYNLARLYERMGRGPDAVRHMSAYRRLIQGR